MYFLSFNVLLLHKLRSSITFYLLFFFPHSVLVHFTLVSLSFLSLSQSYIFHSCVYIHVLSIFLPHNLRSCLFSSLSLSLAAKVSSRVVFLVNLYTPFRPVNFFSLFSNLSSAQQRFHGVFSSDNGSPFFSPLSSCSEDSWTQGTVYQERLYPRPHLRGSPSPQRSQHSEFTCLSLYLGNRPDTCASPIPCHSFADIPSGTQRLRVVLMSFTRDYLLQCLYFESIHTFFQSLLSSTSSSSSFYPYIVSLSFLSPSFLHSLLLCHILFFLLFFCRLLSRHNTTSTRSCFCCCLVCWSLAHASRADWSSVTSSWVDFGFVCVLVRLGLGG